MKFSLLASLIAPLAALAAPLVDRQAKPPAFILTGDSTVSVNKGWGDGFVALARNGALAQNKGHSGATTATFVSGGDWATVLNLVKTNKAKYDVYVTLQFGHNDQKSTSGVSIAQFQTNLQNMANQVKAAGATPVILTSLTRRSFSSGTLKDSLADVSAAAKKAATAVGAQLLDLNAASKKYIQAIGATNAAQYNFASDDTTHLNDKGRALFGRMVADLLIGWKPEFSSYLTANAALTQKIAQGVVA
ncbi:SGNH hydrolase-type esterase domain-containing protein [Plectosphaerella plurivora]|uniref:SGNH hydrolase-type esterase domain-containing protein n=1 Tax=Plectosphaerella plurivora TaxID=936078 RepID=A0A9P8VEJ8_9PEZI|nr:SGNH hydrolase-type esterase domain-containing protein [Plectosphaerella plurivora]